MKTKNKPKNQLRRDYTPLFTHDFLTALANWQRGWRFNQDRRREFADTLVEQCSTLPEKFRHVNAPCYRKRFLLEKEVLPIVWQGHLDEGIASWTLDFKFAQDFRDLARDNTKFAVVFKHKPKKGEVIVNIVALWKNKDFKKAVNNFTITHPDQAKALSNFGDKQSEVILRSTLRGDEIENIVGKSHSFEELCDMASIPEGDREDISKWYAKHPGAIRIEELVYAGQKATKRAVKLTLLKMRDRIDFANKNNILVVWPEPYPVHEDDRKHKAAANK